MKEKISCIYYIKNTMNNKMYIGKTTNFSKRISQHFNNLRNNKHTSKDLQKDFNLFGECYFIFKIIEKCEVDRLDEREKYWINSYDSLYHGYNEGMPNGINNGMEFIGFNKEVVRITTHIVKQVTYQIICPKCKIPCDAASSITYNTKYIICNRCQTKIELDWINAIETIKYN